MENSANPSFNQPITEMPAEFVANGAIIAGEIYSRIAASEHAYVYRITSRFDTVWYHVIPKMINPKTGIAEYPNYKEFGNREDDFESVYGTRSEADAMNHFFTISGF